MRGGPAAVPSAGWGLRLLLLGALLAVLLPAGADACAVCFGGEESDWTTGFVLGTIVMLALPPMIIVGAGFAIYRSIKRHDAEVAASEARERDVESPRPV